MYQKQKQYQTAKSTLRLIANNSEEILSQMEAAATTNIANLKVFFENLRDICHDISELNFESNIDDILSLKAELTDFLTCLPDNILYYKNKKNITTAAASLMSTHEQYIEALEKVSEYDVRKNIELLQKYESEYTKLCLLVLKSKSEKSIIAVTIYRSLVNVFENFLQELREHIEKDESIYDIIQYMTILDAMKFYYVDSVKKTSFYSIMLHTKIKKDSSYLKSCLENTKQLESFNFKKTLDDISKYELYLGILKDECIF